MHTDNTQRVLQSQPHADDSIPSLLILFLLVQQGVVVVSCERTGKHP